LPELLKKLRNLLVLSGIEWRPAYYYDIYQNGDLLKLLNGGTPALLIGDTPRSAHLSSKLNKH